MTEYVFDYSIYADILHVHKKGMQTKGSVEIGDFTVDFGKENDIVGIEIEHASEFFAQLDLSQEDLTQIQEAKIIVDTRNQQANIVFLNLRFPTTTRKISLPMPIVA